MFSLLGFGPEFIRPCPTILKPSNSEVVWLNPKRAYRVALGFGPYAKTRRVAGRSKPDVKAFKGPLVPAQSERVLSEFNADPKIVYHCGLTPSRLPRLSKEQPYDSYRVLVEVDELKPDRKLLVRACEHGYVSAFDGGGEPSYNCSRPTERIYTHVYFQLHFFVREY